MQQPVCRTPVCPGPQASPTSDGKILKDVGRLHPVPEAGPPPLADLLAPFVGDDLPAGFQDHKLGRGCDVVSGPQLAVGDKTASQGSAWGPEVPSKGTRASPVPTSPAKPQIPARSCPPPALGVGWGGRL